ncbi:MAG: peptidyl-prolyl cis-trans isomerase, partial [Gammaproteobacteria bacterium]|nr:peptidyl-prolyl cis-trans isomerase [Gammaproteobacteria bacterium]
MGTACGSESQTSNSSQDQKTMTTENNENTQFVSMKTSLGTIELALDSENAPATVENFLAYVKDKHYDGTVFHRVIPGFMIQGGGFAPGMSQKPTKAPVSNEANNGLLNEEFTIAMARTNDPHSATSQFFINVNDNRSLNFSSETSRGWGYAVFGKVVSGQDVVKKIEAVATGRVGPHGDVPLEDVVIESVTLTDG